VGVKAKFFNNFGNVTPKALQRFNEYYKTIDASGNPKSNLAYGVDLWLKYQETFNLQPFKALGEVPMTELQEATEEITTVKQKAIIQTAINTNIIENRVCVAVCTHQKQELMEIAMNFSSAEGANNGKIVLTSKELGAIVPEAGTPLSIYFTKNPEHRWNTITAPSTWITKVDALHPLFKEIAIYLNMIRSTSDRVLWRNLLANGVSNANWGFISSKINNANFAGAHAEIRALSELIFKIEKIEKMKPGVFPENRLKEIDMVVKKADGNTFQRCPCCYYLTLFVNVISETLLPK
jgi:hypothetical protein